MWPRGFWMNSARVGRRANMRNGGAVSGAAPIRAPQMPAFHLVAPHYRGITLINIGTGPSNARNVTDHVAVLRPHVEPGASVVKGPYIAETLAVSVESDYVVVDL